MSDRCYTLTMTKAELGVMLGLVRLGLAEYKRGDLSGPMLNLIDDVDAMASFAIKIAGLHKAAADER
jgi:hypothetical protein